MPVAVVSINSRTQETIAWAKRYPEVFSAALTPAVRKAAELLAGAVVESQFGGQPLQSRTGKLAASVSSKVIRVGDHILASIGVMRGPATAYARKLEEGGEIRPKRGRALAVPLPDALTPSGRARWPQGPRSVPEAFMLKRPGEPPLICRPLRVAGRKGGRVKKIQPLFVLVKLVTIPPTRWLSGGVEKHLNVFEVAFADDVRRALAVD